MPQENNNATPSSTFLENRRREQEEKKRKQEEINQNVQAGTYTKEDYLPSSESIDASVEDKSTIYQFSEKEGIQLFESTEGKIVPYLRERFKNVLTNDKRKGFTFEETGAFVDRIKVTAPNGKTIVISADNFFEKNNIKSTNQFNAFMLENSKGMNAEDIASTYDNKIVNDVINIAEGNSLTKEQREESRKAAEEDFSDDNIANNIGSWFRGAARNLIEFSSSGMPGSPSSSITRLVGEVSDIIGNTEVANPRGQSLKEAIEYYKETGNKVFVKDENGDQLFDDDGNAITRDATDDDIRNKAIEIRTNTLNERKIQTQLNDYNSEAGNIREVAVETARRKEDNAAAILDDPNYQRVEALGEALEADYKSFNKEIEELNKSFAGSPVWARRFSANDVQRINTLRNNLDSKKKLYEEVSKPYLDALDTKTELGEARDQLDNIAGGLLSSGANFLFSAEDALGSTAWLAGSAPGALFNAIDENLGTDIANNFKYSQHGLQMRGLQMAGRFLKEDAEKNKQTLKKLPEGYNGLLDFAEKGWNGVMENLPLLATAYATGGGSMGANMVTFGLSGMSTKHYEMTKEVETGKAQYSANQMIMAPVLYGVAESATMAAETYMLKGKFNFGKDLFGKGFFGRLGKTVTGYTSAAGGEVVEESFTQVGQNAVDKFMLGKKDVNLYDGFNADFFAKVVGSAGVFQTAGNIKSGIGSVAYNLAATENMQPLELKNSIIEGSQNILNTNMQIADLKNQLQIGTNLSDSQKNDLELEIDVLETKLNQQTVDQQKRVTEALDFSKVGTNGVNKLRKFGKQQTAIQDKIKGIKSALNLTQAQKQELISVLQNEFNTIEEQKSKIINNDNKYQVENEAKVKELETKALENLKEKNNGKQPTKQQIEAEAEAIFDNENFVTEKNAKEAETIMKNQVAKLESENLIDKINNVDATKPIVKLEATSLPQIIQKIETDMESKGYPKDSEQTQQAIQEVKENWDNSAATMIQPEVLQDGQKVLDPEVHTFDKHQIMVVNKKKADTDTDFAARGHDLFHGVLWKAFKSSGQGFKPISDALVKHLNQNDTQGSAWLSGQLSQLDPNSYNYHEEVITKIADGMRSNDIKVSPGIAKSIGNALKTAGQRLGIDTKVFINDPADMFDLIASYNKNLTSDGRLSGALKSALEQGVVVDPKLQPKRQVKPDQRITKQYKDEKAFENKIQKLWEDQKFDEILEAYKPRVRKILESEWKNYLEANDIRPGTQRYNEVVDNVLNGERGILEIAMEYDIKKRVPLSGYIGSIMSKRGISEQVFFIVPDTQGQYRQEIDAQTNKIADEVIEDIVETKKELLKETINLDPGILNEVVKAVTKTFATDLGDITSPKFKQKLQDNFRLQLQKTIKDMLGTRSDYQEYLKNNWESIWNSIPQGIVNKSFPELNDKVLTKEGKQAREKTKAGKPLFKKKKLTEKEFMDYFNPPAINPTTGKRSGLAGTRKDGLANAIAQTLALDEVMDVLSIPEVASKFEDINTLLNRRLPKNYKAYIQKAIDAIDAAIETINDPNTVMAGPPKAIVTGFLNGVKAAMKKGMSFVDAIIDSLNKTVVPWLRTKFPSARVKEIQQELLDVVKNENPLTVKEEQELMDKVIEKMKTIDPKKDYEDANFMALAKELSNMSDTQLEELKISKAEITKLKETLKSGSHNISTPNEASYSKPGIEAKIEAKDAMADAAFEVLDTLPEGVYDNLVSIMGRGRALDFLGLQTRIVNIAKDSKYPTYYDKFFNEDGSPKFNTKGKNTPAEVESMWKDVPFKKVQPLNVEVFDSPMLKELQEISAKKMPKEEKKQAMLDVINKYPDLNTANKKLAKAIAQTLIYAYKNGKMSQATLFTNLKSGSDIAGSFRSLGGIGGFTLEAGSLEINKGEHADSNSATMDELFKFIISDKSNSPMSIEAETELENILDKDQIFGNKEKYFDPIDDFSKAKLKKGKPMRGLPKTSTLGMDRFIKVLGNKAKNVILLDGNNAFDQSISTEFKREKQKIKEREVNKKSAEKVNQETFGDMDAETRKNWDKARELARDPNQPQKGITIVDFDDTLATSNSKVIVNMPDGTTKKITPAEFAKQHSTLESEGAKFDFSEFNKVIGGKPGPFFNKVQKLADKFGTEQIHILTARPQASAAAIQAFMKGLGLDINIDNIIGLEDGRPEAKRDFIIKKAAEGFNDFLFADDVTANTKAVEQALDALDIKSDIRTEDKNFKRDLNLEFNKIIEQNKGLDRNAVVSEARAKSKGAKRGNWFTNFFLAPSAEDFAGLLYTLLGKGKKGEQQWAFLKKALIDPFARGIRDLNAFKQVLANELKALKDLYPEVTKSLRKNSGVGDYNNAHAIRVYNWNKAGYTAGDLGISQTDFNNLIKVVEANSDMKAFADGVRPITKVKEGYPAPKDSWIIGNIDTDMQDVGNTAKRSEFLKEFNDNVEQIFTPENIRKLELIYGSKFTEALDDMLYRMQYGTNRTQGSSRIVNRWQNWVNNSVGAIMFFNMRSAFLQTLSSVNFMNWSDNNPLMAAKAFANQKQFWKDFSFIFNHPTLKQRRAGLDIDVNASEIAKRVQESNNPVSAALSYLLQIGFTPTRIADSFAIAIGGASMYRNRINTYKKKGLSDTEAADKAFLDFQEISEATQQSARPDMISQQQASVLGRLILAFQVTPMQYARLIKRSIQDLAAGRGDRKTHISKILYYGAAQNILFNSLQSALFALAYGTDDEEEDEKLTDKEKRKLTRIANNSVDTLLRGLGVQGAAVATIKNMVIKFLEQEKRGYRADHAYTLIEGLNISPPIGSKARKVYGGTQSYKFNREAIKEMGLDIDNPAYDAVSNVVSGTTNLPLDRVLANINNLRGAIDKRNQAWQRIALLMGWNTWDVEVPNRDLQKAKEDIKKRKAEERRKKKKK